MDFGARNALKRAPANEGKLKMKRIGKIIHIPRNVAVAPKILEIQFLRHNRYRLSSNRFFNDNKLESFVYRYPAQVTRALLSVSNAKRCCVCEPAPGGVGSVANSA